MMLIKRIKCVFAVSFVAAALTSTPVSAEVNLNVNIGVGAPDYYGVLPIQGVTPQLWNENPIVAIGAAIAGAPIYLTVPNKHRRNWRRYCAQYGACGVPVYFVQRGWYNHHYGHAAPPPPPPGSRYDRPPKHHNDHEYRRPPEPPRGHDFKRPPRPHDGFDGGHRPPPPDGGHKGGRGDPGGPGGHRHDHH